MDIIGARVPNATVIVKGKETTYKVVTGEDGTYEIELPAGIYRISVNELRGFSSTRRAAFYLRPSTTTIFDFTLFSPESVSVNYTGAKYGEVLDDGPRTGFKYEVFSLSRSAGVPLELMFQYGERKVEGSIIEYKANVISYGESMYGEPYPGVVVSYNLMTIHANKVRFDRNLLNIEAEGNIFIEDGRQRIRAKRAEVQFKASEPIIKLFK
jgi:hypothetical protein